MLRWVVLVTVLLGAGCSAGPATTSTVATSPAPTTTEAPATTISQPPTTEPMVRVPPSLSEFDLDSIELDGSVLTVAVADTSEKRQQGLMGVEEMLDVDGMLFVFDGDVSTGFWMKNTLIDLDIAFFTVAGEFVDGFVMEPCTEDPCPVYRPSGSYRYALEMAAGDMPADVRLLSR